MFESRVFDDCWMEMFIDKVFALIHKDPKNAENVFFFVLSGFPLINLD